MKMRYFRKSLKIVLLALLTLSSALGANAARIYVNISNLSSNQDGSSWAKAFASLQSALEEAESTEEPDEIWVATGVYVPSQIYSPNGIVGGASGLNTPFLRTFNLPDQVSIFGGFAGIEHRLEQRNPEANPTTLSGAFSGGEVWHVVTLGNDIAKTGVRAKLDSLIIANGDANGPSGGSIFFAPFVYDHSFGGGIYAAFDSKLDIETLIFVNNSANLTGGGTLGIAGAVGTVNTDLHIKCSKFDNNFSAVSGGAIQTYSQFENKAHTTIIEDSTFTNNDTGIFGGALVGEGILPLDDSCVTIKNCSFVNNSAIEGGAIVFDSIRSFVENSTFIGNNGSVSAGALATTNVVNTFVNAQLYGPNSSFTKYSTTISGSSFINNVAQGNKAIHDGIFGGPAASGVDFPLGGGALVSYINGILHVRDSKFVNNRTDNGPGGAIVNGSSAGVNILGTGAVAFEASTKVENSTFFCSSAKQTSNVAPNLLGNGGAFASLPGTFFNIPQQNVGSLRVRIENSKFEDSSAGGNGGAIYLNTTTARLKHNEFKNNFAILNGNNIFEVNSVINGDLAN